MAGAPAPFHEVKAPVAEMNGCLCCLPFPLLPLRSEPKGRRDHVPSQSGAGRVTEVLVSSPPHLPRSPRAHKPTALFARKLLRRIERRLRYHTGKTHSERRSMSLRLAKFLLSCVVHNRNRNHVEGHGWTCVAWTGRVESMDVAASPGPLGFFFSVDRVIMLTSRLGSGGSVS